MAMFPSREICTPTLRPLTGLVLIIHVFRVGMAGFATLNPFHSVK